MATEIRRDRFVVEPGQEPGWALVFDWETRSYLMGQHPQWKAEALVKRFNAMPPAACQEFWVPLVESREMEVVGSGR